MLDQSRLFGTIPLFCPGANWARPESQWTQDLVYFFDQYPRPRDNLVLCRRRVRARILLVRHNSKHYRLVHVAHFLLDRELRSPLRTIKLTDRFYQLTLNVWNWRTYLLPLVTRIRQLRQCRLKSRMMIGISSAGGVCWLVGCSIVGLLSWYVDSSNLLLSDH
jgi:hypothetical protein